MEQAIKDLALLLGGWTVIVTGIIGFISYLATQKIISAWDAKNQKELEVLRNNQAETQLLLGDTISTISSSQSLLQSHRVEAVDKLWKAILSLKEHYSMTLFFFTINRPDEYGTVLSNPKIFASIRKIDDAYINDYSQDVKDLENFRPYLGETLWLQFFVYRAVLGRLALLIIWIKEGKKISDWRQDSGIQQLLNAIFDKDEFDAVIKTDVLAIQYVLNTLDNKILKEISFILSGRKSLLESFESAKELRKLLANEKM